MENLINHLETHLGKIQVGWSVNEAGKKMPFQVLRFERGPVEGSSTFTTLGLSDNLLLSPKSNKIIKQELVFVVNSNFGYKNIPGILQQVGLEAINKGKAYIRGDVIGPRGQLVDGSTMEALYVGIPVYFPDSFHTFLPNKGQPIIMVWLVPISSQESAYVKSKGWDLFEDKLVSYDPDVIDLYRKSMPL